MITGELNDLKNYMEEKDFHKIVTYIKQVRSGEAVVNEWVHFDGGKLVKAITLNKSNYQEGIKEFHKVYTDIHITLSGEDTIFTGDQVSGEIEPYREDGDYALIQSPSAATDKILPGHFAMILPNEMHANELAGDSPLKVVIKLNS